MDKILIMYTSENINLNKQKNMRNTFRIAITGATGLLGRNLLFQILKENLTTLDNIELVLFIRMVKNEDPKLRLKEILLADGIDYLNLEPQEAKSNTLIEHILKNIKVVNIDLSGVNLDISVKDADYIKKTRFDLFFHISAMTDFRDTPEIINNLYEINVNGTQKLLSLINPSNTSRFCYVSSAYACGKKSGIIYPDYKHDGIFRNTYEKTKMLTETMVENVLKEKNVEFKIFRPSTLCGRLIEKTLGSTCKFDVFYRWAAFLKYQRIKAKAENNKPISLPIRFACNTGAGLNIVPVDFAAKLMWALSQLNEDTTHYHLCNATETQHKGYARIVTDFLNVTDYAFVDSIPATKNQLEALYYRTVGKVFTPYVISEPMNFDMTNEQKTMNKLKLKYVPIDETRLRCLLEYAERNGFGL